MKKELLIIPVVLAIIVIGLIVKTNIHNLIIISRNIFVSIINITIILFLLNKLFKIALNEKLTNVHHSVFSAFTLFVVCVGVLSFTIFSITDGILIAISPKDKKQQCDKVIHKELIQNHGTAHYITLRELAGKNDVKILVNQEQYLNYKLGDKIQITFTSNSFIGYVDRNDVIKKCN